MKGFGDKDRNRTDRKSIAKKSNSWEKNKLISSALSLHSEGKIKEALEIYILIQNKIDDPRVFNNLGSIYSQQKFDKAILLFDESIKKFRCIEAYPNLANVLVAKGSILLKIF